jgi:hypothetical protein
MIRNGSIGSRNRGVSALISTTLNHRSAGVSASHRQARRASPVKTPASATSASTQKLITPA